MSVWTQYFKSLWVMTVFYLKVRAAISGLQEKVSRPVSSCGSSSDTYRSLQEHMVMFILLRHVPLSSRAHGNVYSPWESFLCLRQCGPDYVPVCLRQAASPQLSTLSHLLTDKHNSTRRNNSRAVACEIPISFSLSGHLSEALYLLKP